MYKSGKGLIATAAPEVADDDAPKAKQLLRKLTVKFIPTAPSAKDFAAAVADADAEAVAVVAAAAAEEKRTPVAEAAPAADAYGARRGSIPMGAQMRGARGRLTGGRREGERVTRTAACRGRAQTRLLLRREIDARF